MAPARRVAVIGAGVSGLVTVKELLAEGHRPTCFEKAPSLGGVFQFREDDGLVWESCRLTSSRLLTAFSDFPIPGPVCEHPKAAEFVGYLQQYADAFGLLPHVRFGTSVRAVERAANSGTGEWRIQVDGPQGTTTETFDAVAVCTGLNQNPHVPQLPGFEQYAGEWMHSSQYRRPAQVKGKRVLVIGAGESAVDIVAEAAAHAAETVLSLRRGLAVVPRKRAGQPRDHQTSRLLNTPAHWIFQTRNPADEEKRRLYRWMFVPFLFVDKALQWTSRLFWEYLPLLQSESLADLKIKLRMRKLTAYLLATSGGTLNEQFRTKTDEFVRVIAEGRCRQVGAVERFDGNRVLFQQGGEFHPDVVIFGTGFQIRMPFLDPAIWQAPRYLHTFHPETGASLAFIGYARPAAGAIPPVAELQARWFAQLLSGNRQLPSVASMQASIAYWQQYRAHFFRAVKGRLPHLVEYTLFCDELAAQAGCKPSLAEVRGQSRRFQQRFWEGPFVAAQYRIAGPHAKPELARKVIESLPVMTPWPDRLNLKLRLFLSRTLHRMAGDAYAPKLRLEP